jgi:hypothetical protein
LRIRQRQQGVVGNLQRRLTLVVVDIASDLAELERREYRGTGCSGPASAVGKACCAVERRKVEGFCEDQMFCSIVVQLGRSARWYDGSRCRPVMDQLFEKSKEESAS